MGSYNTSRMCDDALSSYRSDLAARIRPRSCKTRCADDKNCTENSRGVWQNAAIETKCQLKPSRPDQAFLDCYEHSVADRSGRLKTRTEILQKCQRQRVLESDKFEWVTTSCDLAKNYLPRWDDRRGSVEQGRASFHQGALEWWPLLARHLLQRRTDKENPE